MSYNSSGVLQPFGLTEAAFLHAPKFSFSKQFDVRWANAESRIAELLSCIQPNGHSELQRKAVADYISGLVKRCLDCEVFRFGSVPLKTYLPDGDIDLTAFSSHQELRDTWALDVQTVLEREVQRKDAEFTVSNVQCIHAEVKIVKCVVDSIVVDISFNQLGGLCTLCFLEEVDRLIQKKHLFKRSIILVKAWCYYESRILGAHHALISTYALETLVLYIFNVFHSTLRGPLEVLFTFLDYFSKFDWEKYCVSIWGPVPLDSLPDLTAEPPLKEGSKLLLSKGFLETCSALYDVFPKGGDTQARTFSGKYLNIVDPLRINNNLGRSVSQANYHRIRSAFHRGARRLAKLFEVVDEDFPKCLDEFFSNTWEMHQTGHRPDAPTSIFLPYEKFVYKTGYIDMPGDDREKRLFRSPELKKSSWVSDDKIIKDGKSSSQILHSRALVEEIRMETADWKSGRDLGLQGSKFSTGHGGITDLTYQVGCQGPKTSVNMQSTLICNMPLAVSTDSVLRTSSLRKSSLEEGRSMAPMQTCKAPASSKRTASEKRLEKSLDADVMKSCGPLQTVQQTEVEESRLKNDSQGGCKSGCSPVKGGLGKSNGGFSDVSSATEVCDTLAVMHGQSCIVRGKSWPTFNIHESKRSAASSATLNGTRTRCASSTVKELIPSDTAIQKPPDFLFPEPRDLLYVSKIPSFSLPPFETSSSSSIMAASPFPDPSASPELDGVKAKNLACASSVQVTTTMSLGISQGPALEDVQSFIRHIPQLDGLTSQHQIFEQQQQQPFQFLQQSEQALLQSNVDWEHSDVYLLSPNNLSATHAEAAEARISNDVSNVMGEANLSGHMAIPSEDQEFSWTLKKDEKMQLSRQEYFDTHYFTRRKGELCEGSEVTTYPSRVLAIDSSNTEACFCSELPQLSNLTSSCEVLPNYAPSCHQVFPTTLDVSKAGPNEGLGVSQRPFDFVDASESVLFGMATVKTSLVQEGGNHMARGKYLGPPVGAIPVVSHYNPFYPAFPVDSFSPHIPHENKVFLDGMLGGSPLHIYHGSGQMPESIAAALNARFASLSAEESGVEPTRDLLRSDLANHLQNLQFGRWCQEPAALQPLSEPPYMYHNSQEPYFWGNSPFTPLHGSSNQAVDNLKGPVPVLLSPQNVGGMPGIIPCPGTSHIHKPEKGIGSFLPVRNGIYRDLKPLSPPIALQHDQGHTRTKTHSSSLSVTSAAPALLAPPSRYDTYNGVTDSQAFVNSMGEHGAIGSNFANHSPGSVLPFVAGQLEFGSLGPIEIMSFPCGNVGTNMFGTSFTCFSPFFETQSSKMHQK